MASFTPRGQGKFLLALLLVLLCSMVKGDVCTTQPSCIITGTVLYDAQTFSSDVTISGSTAIAADSILKPSNDSTILITVQNGAVLTLSNLTLWGPSASIAVVLLDTASLIVNNVNLPSVGGVVGAGVVFQVSGTQNNVQVNGLNIGNRNGLATFLLAANSTNFTATNVASLASQETFLISGQTFPYNGISISLAQSTFQYGVASVVTGSDCNPTFTAPLIVDFHSVSASISVSGCTFSRNSGNLFTMDNSISSTLTISDSLFFNNTGLSSQSMLILAFGTLNTTVIRCNVTNSFYSSATTANFIYSQNILAGRVELTNLVFTKNTFTRPLFYFLASSSINQTVDIVATNLYVSDTTCTICDATGFMFYASGSNSYNKGNFLMTGSTFVNNTSNGGATFHVYSSLGNGNQLSSAKFLSCNFINSVALATATVSSTSTASGISFLFGNAQVLVLDHCVFTNNKGNRYGPLYLGKANFPSVTITNSVMTANSQTFGALTTDTNTVNMNIDNLVATGNVGTQGGGFSELFNAEMTLTVSNSIFTGNAAGTSQGGGFYYTCAACPIGPTLTFNNVTFTANTGSSGSAVAVATASNGVGNFFFNDVTFKDNIASTGDGGALFIGQGNFNVALTGTTSFTNNKATAGNGGAVALSKVNAFTMSNLPFTKNFAGKSGGAFYVSGNNGVVTLTGLTFTNNTASLSGGAIFASGIPLTLTQSAFSGNLSPAGSAVYATGLLGTSSSLTNLNFTRNGATTAASQGALYLGATAGSISLNNLIFTANSDAFYATGAHTGAGVQATNWAVTGTSNSFVDLSGLGAPMIALSGYTGTISLSNSVISGNVNPKGTVFSVAGGTLSLSNTQVVSNTASVLLASVNSVVNLANCNISSNTAVDPTVGIQSLIALSQAANVAVTGSLISGNTAEILWSHDSAGSSNIQTTNFTSNTYSTNLMEISQGSLSINSIILQQTGLPDQPGPCFTATNAAVLSMANSAIVNCHSTRGPAVLWARDFASFTLTGSSVSGAKAPAAAIKIADSSTAQITTCSFSQCSSGILAFQGNVLANVSNCDLSDSSSSSIDPTFVHLSEGAAVTVTNSRFQDGVSDYNPCIKVENARLTMTNSSLTGCQNAQTGGGIHFTGTASSSIDTTTFDSNVAGVGGGALSFLQLVGSTISFDDCKFTGNSANMGGVFSSSMAPGSSLSFTNSEFSDNEATQFGGVFYASDSSVVTIESSTFTNNQASDAGIGYGDWYANVALASSTIQGSEASHQGGSFVLDKYAQLTVSDSSISQSTSPNGDGGAIYMTVSSVLVVNRSNFTSNSANMTGGVIGVNSVNDCQVNLTSSIFDGNSAEEGGAIFFGPTSENRFFVMESTFMNNIAALGGAIAGESHLFPALDHVVYSNNVATIFGDDVYGRPENLVLAPISHLSLLSGETLPDLEVGLYDFREVRYTLEPKPQFLIYLTAAGISLTGEVSASFVEGKATFSKVKVIGSPGIYTLTIGPSTSDTFYNHDRYAITVQVTISPCTGRYFQSVDQTCNLITCNGCPVDDGATCVSPGNCSCPTGKEGLQCQLPTDAYDSIFLKFSVLPTPPGLMVSEINVETRDYLLAQLAVAYNGDVSVVYCAFYFEEKKTRDGSSHYVLKYSLTKNGQYLEQESLVEYQLAATSHFADLHSGSEPAASVNLVEVHHLEASDPLVVAVIVITAILLLLTMVTMVLVFLRRDTPVIKSASPIYCLMMLVGIILAYLTFIPYIGAPTALSCMAPVVMGSLSFSIVFGNLLAKTFRIYRIFSNRKMRVVAPSNSMLLLFTLTIVSIEMVIVAIWLGVNPPVPFRTGPDTARFETCYSELDHTMVAILMAYNGVLLLFGIFLAFKTRKAYSAFRESQLIGFTIYTLSIFTVAVLPVLFGVELDLTTQFAIRSFAIIVVTTVALGFLFGTKMFIIVFHPEKNSSEFLKEENRSGSMHAFSMKKMDRSELNSSVDIMNMASKSVGHVMICEDKPWSQWKRKYAVLYGDYFGFFEDDAHFDEKGGLHPLAFWQVSEIDHEECKLKISAGKKGYILDAATPQDLQKWYDMLKPKSLPSSAEGSKQSREF